MSFVFLFRETSTGRLKIKGLRVDGSTSPSALADNEVEPPLEV